MQTNDIELMPYLSFQGNCEEALHFYKNILNGEIEIASRYDNPAMNAAEVFKNKILHAVFRFGKHVLFASDVMPKNEDKIYKSNVAISLGLHDESASEDIFNKLSAGGAIHVPFKKQFWGDWHGNFTDRFGIHWMINCSK
jgi:PhnB protein